jgi:hypothetical protein
MQRIDSTGGAAMIDNICIRKPPFTLGAYIALPPQNPI